MQAPPGVSMLLCVAMKHLEELKAGDEAIAKVSIMYRQIEAPLPLTILLVSFNIDTLKKDDFWIISPNKKVLGAQILAY